MWLDEWRAISGRIRSLVEAGAFFLRTNDTEMHNASNYLIENAHDTVQKIRAFDKTFGNQLQNEQRECLFLFLKSYANDLVPPYGSPSGFSGVTSVVTYLASFRAEFEYLS